MTADPPRSLVLRDDAGRPLRATASVEPTSTGAIVHLASQSGRSDGPRARNPAYKEALEVLLRRVGACGGVLIDARVASRLRQGVEETPRDLLPESGMPLELASVNAAELRDELIQLQRVAGQRLGAGGTGAQHKRIRLVFHTNVEPSEFMAEIAGGQDDLLQEVDDALTGHHAQSVEPDAVRRRAVERYAVRRACAYYRQRFAQVESRENTEPFDLLCREPGELRVEVKGTRSAGQHVAMTAAEVALARDPHLATELFVVSQIGLRSGADGRLEGTGGIVSTYADWAPSPGELTALAYRCTLPSSWSERPRKRQSRRD